MVNQYKLIKGIPVDKGDRELYDKYDKKFTDKLEKKLLESDITKQIKGFPNNTLSLLEKRYFINDSDGNIIENIQGMFARVAANIAYPDKVYGASEKEVYKTAEAFYKMMGSADFMPNSPALMNAGRQLQQLSACFVLPIEDSMDSILQTQKDAGLVHKSGGGTGFFLGEMRMANDIVSSTYGLSSGPIRFLGAYDATTHAVNQGGTRRGANMGSMSDNHPDIIQFIKLKTKEGECANFNLSVALSDDFMKAVERDDWYTLKNPKKGKLHSVYKKDLETIMRAVGIDKIKREDTNFYLEDGKVIENIGGLSARFNEDDELQLKANEVFDYLAQSAWRLGEPGVLFMDTINKYNSTPNLGRIKATNPCGEQPLLAYEACNLGSINLFNFVKNKRIDKKKLEEVVRKAVHFLDNVVDMSRFPLPKITEMVHKTRKIGLGIMGWANTLIKMKIAYDSDKAVDLAREVMGFINETAKDESEKIAKQRGVFPAYFGSIYDRKRLMRNANLTTIAPTGTISKIAKETSQSGEPLFAVLYTHTDADGTERTSIAPSFLGDLKKAGLSEKKVGGIIDKLKGKKDKKGKGWIQKPVKLHQIKEVPKQILEIYRTADVVPTEYHIKMQVAFQEHTDSAVSKTINMPNSASVEDTKHAYLLAHKLGCKGITIYRDESREKQVLTSGAGSGLEEIAEEVVLMDVNIGSKSIEIGDDVQYYKIKKGDETFHLTIVGEFWEDKENKKVYILPTKMFQNMKPLGKEESTEFAQSGLDRTGRLKSLDPDYRDMIVEWKSATGDKIVGMGPNRINSPTHGVGLAFEHYCLRNRLVDYNENNNLVNAVNKPSLKKIEDPKRKKQLKKKMSFGGAGEVEHKIYDNIMTKFECERCHSTEFHREAGCSDAVCNFCGWSIGKCG